MRFAQNKIARSESCCAKRQKLLLRGTPFLTPCNSVSGLLTCFALHSIRHAPSPVKRQMRLHCPLRLLKTAGNTCGVQCAAGWPGDGRCNGSPSPNRQVFLTVHGFIHGNFHPCQYLLAANAYCAIKTTHLKSGIRRRAPGMRVDACTTAVQTSGHLSEATVTMSP